MEKRGGWGLGTARPPVSWGTHLGQVHSQSRGSGGTPLQPCVPIAAEGVPVAGDGGLASHTSAQHGLGTPARRARGALALNMTGGPPRGLPLWGARCHTLKCVLTAYSLLSPWPFLDSSLCQERRQIQRVSQQRHVHITMGRDTSATAASGCPGLLCSRTLPHECRVDGRWCLGDRTGSEWWPLAPNTWTQRPVSRDAMCALLEEKLSLKIRSESGKSQGCS